MARIKLKNGLLSGRGTYEYNGVEYEGNFKKGNGMGRCRNLPGHGSPETHGMLYVGEFKKMNWHGEGKVFDSTGKLIMEGSFKDNKLEGKSKVFAPDFVAEGIYRNGKLNGQGKRSSADITEEGIFLNDYLHKGVVISLNSNTTVSGEFDNGDWNGKMTITSTNYKATCEYRKDKRHGRCEYFYTDGATFKGKFEDDVCVDGEFRYADGSRDVGEFNQKDELIRGYSYDINKKKTKVKVY